MFINEKTGSIRRSMLHINVTNAIRVFCALWVEGYRTGSASDRERLARNNISILSSLHDELHCLVLPVATAPGSVFVVPRQSSVWQKIILVQSRYSEQRYSTVMLLVETPSAPQSHG